MTKSTNRVSLMRTSGIVCAISLVMLSIFNLNQFASAQLTYDANNKFVSLTGENNVGVKINDNIKTYQITDPTISKSSCVDMPISSVTSSGGSNGNSAFRAVDKDIGTKWSGKGTGSFLQADLGSPKAVCNVGIAWDKGNHKTYDFVLSASNDTSNFKDILKGTSTKGSDFQTYDLGHIHAQYVRVTLNSNNGGHDKSASIKELSIKGADVPSNIVTDAATRCSKLGNHWIESTSSDGPNTPDKSVDNNLGTHWSSPGYRCIYPSRCWISKKYLWSKHCMVQRRFYTIHIALYLLLRME